MEKIKELSHEEKLKIRNEKICNRFNEIMDDDDVKLSAWGICGKVHKELLTENIELTQRHIYQIIIDNGIVKPINKEKEKLRRFWKLRKLEKDKKKSKKDIVDILEEERKEIEGNTPLIDQSQHYTLVLQIEKENDEKIKIAREAVASI